jgi:hypothetical protein
MRDVVVVIVAHVADDVRCLLAAVRVNRLWADVATGWLWRSPPGAALAYVNGSSCCGIVGSRSAYYDSKVRHITVVGDNTCGYSKVAARYSDLQGWRLPHITHLTFVRPRSAVAAAALLRRVLEEQQPLVRLRQLTWHDDSVAAAADAHALNDIFSLLLRHAPRMSLLSLSLNTVNAVPGPAALLALLKALPSFTDVELEGPKMGDALDDAVIIFLALNPHIRHLRFEKRVALPSSLKLPVFANVWPRHATVTDTGAQIAAHFRNTTPFRCVTSFVCGIAPRAMPSFAAMVSLLTSLDITLFAGDFALALGVIASRLTLLRSLRIMFSGASHGSSSSSDAATSADGDGANEMLLYAHDFYGLSRLKRLRSLQLATASHQPPLGEEGINSLEWRQLWNIGFALDCEAFELLVQGLPELRCLRIDLGSAMALSYPSLRDAGNACRMLETLELRGNFYLRYLRPQGHPTSPTIFRCLTRLELSNVYTEYDALTSFSTTSPPSFFTLIFSPNLFERVFRFRFSPIVVAPECA